MKKFIERLFSKKISSKEKMPFIAYQAGLRLIERLKLVKLQPKHILFLDESKKSTELSLLIKKRFPKASITEFCPHNHPYSIPLKDQSFDLIFANAVIFQNDITATFSEWSRLLKKGGLISFSSFGPDTFKELQSLLTNSPHIEWFDHLKDMHLLGDALLRTKFSDSVVDMQLVTLTYRKFVSLLKDIKASFSGLNREALLEPFPYRRLRCEYELTRNVSALLPATLEIIYGHAWGQGLALSPTCKSQKSKASSMIPMTIV